MKTIDITEIRNDQLTDVTGGINSCDPAFSGKGIIIKEIGGIKTCDPALAGIDGIGTYDPPLAKAVSLAFGAIIPPKAIIKEK